MSSASATRRIFAAKELDHDKRQDLQRIHLAAGVKIYFYAPMLIRLQTPNIAGELCICPIYFEHGARFQPYHLHFKQTFYIVSKLPLH